MVAVVFVVLDPAMIGCLLSGWCDPSRNPVSQKLVEILRNVAR
jgi:hypothetical protein